MDQYFNDEPDFDDFRQEEIQRQIEQENFNALLEESHLQDEREREEKEKATVSKKRIAEEQLQRLETQRQRGISFQPSLSIVPSIFSRSSIISERTPSRQQQFERNLSIQERNQQQVLLRKRAEEREEIEEREIAHQRKRRRILEETIIEIREQERVDKENEVLTFLQEEDKTIEEERFTLLQAESKAKAKERRRLKREQKKANKIVKESRREARRILEAESLQILLEQEREENELRNRERLEVLLEEEGLELFNVQPSNYDYQEEIEEFLEEEEDLIFFSEEEEEQELERIDPDSILPPLKIVYSPLQKVISKINSPEEFHDIFKPVHPTRVTLSSSISIRFEDTAIFFDPFFQGEEGEIIEEAPKISSIDSEEEGEISIKPSKRGSIDSEEEEEEGEFIHDTETTIFSTIDFTHNPVNQVEWSVLKVYKPADVAKTPKNPLLYFFSTFYSALVTGAFGGQKLSRLLVTHPYFAIYLPLIGTSFQIAGTGELELKSTKLGPFSLADIIHIKTYKDLRNYVKDILEPLLKKKNEANTFTESSGLETLLEEEDFINRERGDEESTERFLNRAASLLQTLIVYAEFRFIPSAKIPIAVEMGCRPDSHRLPFKIRKPDIFSPTGANDNNCVLECVLEQMLTENGFEYTYSFQKLQSLRKRLGFSADNLIDMNELEVIAKFTKRNIEVYTILHTGVGGSKNKVAQVIDNLFEKDSSSKNANAPKGRIFADKRDCKISSRAFLTKVVNYSLCDGDKVGLEPIRLLYHEKHAFGLKKSLLSKVRCSFCGIWVKEDTFFSSHQAKCRYCAKCSSSYSLKIERTSKEEIPHICKERRVLEKNEFFSRAENGRRNLLEKIKEKEKEELDGWSALKKNKVEKRKSVKREQQIWYADIEAFPQANEDNYFSSYALGVINAKEGDSSYRCFYGENSLIDFLKYAVEHMEGTLFFFNGGKFDGFLVLRAMVEHGFLIEEDVVMHSGTLMSFNIHSKLVVHDMYLFINSSLDRACKEWNVPKEFCKGSFDHSKVFSFESAELHKKEVKEYLLNDVRSMKCIHKTYYTAMEECFKRDVIPMVTPSQFAMKCWKDTPGLPLDEIYIPKTGKEEDDDRAAYFGGRTLPQKREWSSEDYKGDDHKEKDYNYSEIKDYCVMVDVNSLYPAAQRFNKFAHGKWNYWSPKSNAEERIIIEKIIEGKDDFVKRCMFRVDISCPKNILTAFLMSKVDGVTTHDLLDKRNVWYWGAELSEACLLNYNISAIYEVKEFPLLSDLFSFYVDKCYNGRKENKNTKEEKNPKNLIYKLMMNSLTGKFAQRSLTTKTVLLQDSNVNKMSEENLQALLAKVSGYVPLTFASTKRKAALLEVEITDPQPSYPIYLSAQILSYARILMSQIMREGDCYFNKENAILYTDTDSLTVPSKCLTRWMTQKSKEDSSVPKVWGSNRSWIGGELGQMKCDLSESFEKDEFAKIVAVVFAAPKGPYSIVYSLPGITELTEKVRCKGIPHPSGPFKFSEDVFLTLDKDNSKLMGKALNYVNNKFSTRTENGLSSIIPTPKLISKRFYRYITSKGTVKFITRLNIKIIKDMMSRIDTMEELKKKEKKNSGILLSDRSVLTCFFGGMKKAFFSNGTLLRVRPTIIQRAPCKTNWWLKNKRLTLEGAKITDLTFPCGYE